MPSYFLLVSSYLSRSIQPKLLLFHCNGIHWRPVWQKARFSVKITCWLRIIVFIDIDIDIHIDIDIYIDIDQPYNAACISMFICIVWLSPIYLPLKPLLIFQQTMVWVLTCVRVYMSAYVSGPTCRGQDSILIICSVAFLIILLYQSKWRGIYRRYQHWWVSGSNGLASFYPATSLICSRGWTIPHPFYNNRHSLRLL